MADLEALKTKYPDDKIKSAPLEDCTGCHGTGECASYEGIPMACLCVLVEIDDDHRRRLMMAVFESIRKFTVM
jgi:hypothetical protein